MNKKIWIFVVLFFGCILLFFYIDKEHIEYNEAKYKKENELFLDMENNDTGYKKLEEKINYEAGAEVDSANKLKQIFVEIMDIKQINQELQHYITGQTTIVDNHISMKAEKVGEKYISGKLETKVGFKYGVFEWDIKTVVGDGVFPAIWMLPMTGQKYPEIDIYEMIGNEPNLIYGVEHYYTGGQQKRVFFQHRFSHTELPKEFRLKFVWSEDEMIWYIDNEEVYRVNENVPQEPMYMIMNLAIGGVWPGDPTDEKIFPVTFDSRLITFKTENIYMR